MSEGWICRELRDTDSPSIRQLCEASDPNALLYVRDAAAALGQGLLLCRCQSQSPPFCRTLLPPAPNEDPMDSLTRCNWCGTDPLYVAYHDEEWGVPVHDDRTLFEFLVLESAQAGLSWRTILGKRQGYRRCFLDFDPEAVARMGAADIDRLVLDPGIVRNRAKIAATVKNAQIFLQLQERHGSFSAWQWGFVDGQPIVNHWNTLSELPAKTALSDRMAAECKRLGFSFLGSTVLYAHLQATGVINDHLVGCFRRGQLTAGARS